MIPAASFAPALLFGMVLFSYTFDRFWWNHGYSPLGRRWPEVGRTPYGGRRYRDEHGFCCVIHWPIDNR